MHPRTEATLNELYGVEWFRNVGVHDTQTAEVLSSWDEAIESCGSLEWENLCLEAANQYCERLAEREPAILATWNEKANTLRPLATALVSEKCAAMVAAVSPPKVFIDTVRWDILHLCMEAEYADIYPPGFYASQSYWYFNGHFPCGWRGEFPSGNIIVY